MLLSAATAVDHMSDACAIFIIQSATSNLVLPILHLPMQGASRLNLDSIANEVV
jgi:hypothetical protein